MECTECGLQLSPLHRHCPQCGAPADRACPDCRAPVSESARFCPSCGTKLGQANVPASDSAAASAAELRQTTVLICDIVDSTALTNALEPEDAREVLVRSQQRIKEVVHRHKSPTDCEFDRDEGDSQLFCFGLPHAQEDDAERAVKAALEIVAEVAKLRVIPDVTVRVRVGVATGVVIVGHPPGAPMGRKPVITGATPNLAARLQAAAMPNTVVISSTTRKLVGDLFDCVNLGALWLKGFSEPVNAWRVDRVRSVASRFDALHPPDSLTPLVGREQEIGSLLDRWQLVREGVGQAVAIGGDPGIGKSRMLRALRDRLKPEVATVVQLQCSPYYVNSAFYPVAICLEQMFNFRRDEPASERLARIEQLLVQRFARPARDVQLIAQVLRVPTGARYAPLATTPQRRKQDTVEALLDLVEAIAGQGRCLILFEDTHWADPSTRELLSGLIARVPRCAAFLLITHRPEFDARTLAHEGLARLTLSRLSRAQGAVLAARFAGEEGLPGEVLDRILIRSDGIPLFIEELTKATLESREMKAAEGSRAPAPSDIPVPATLRDSLMARLDRLPAGKAVAQIGAVIGREFSYELLSAVAPLTKADMDRALSSLTESGLTSALESESGPIYVFKHALLQDIARDSLLRSARQELNCKIARALEERFPDTAQAHPELLAHYYTEATVYDQAVEYWKRAGDLATQRSANLEAINQLEKGLLLARSLADGAARKQQELELHAILGRAMVAAKGYASPEVEETFARARELFPHVGDSTHKFVVLRGECQLLAVQARYDGAFERANELLRLADEERNSGYLLDAHLLIGLAHLYRGGVELAREHLERCARIYDPVQHLPHAVRQGVDIGSAVLAYLARALWILGYPDLALQRSIAAVELARTSSIPLGLAQASGMLALVHHVRGDLVATKEWVDKTLHYAVEQGHVYWIALAGILDSWLRAHEGRSQEAAAEIARSIGRYKDTGARLGMSSWLLLLAEAYQQAGQHDLGLQALAEALQHIDETGEAYYAAEAHRRRGELLLARSRDVLGAQACFQRALGIAREQHARAWELRAATSLARLWSDQGRAGDAHQLLDGVYRGFTEGHDTEDLREAARLLSASGSARPGQAQAVAD